MQEYFKNNAPLQRRSPLLRAMTESANPDSSRDSLQGIHILDGSAGLGIDAFLLAREGAQVTLVEKNPIVHCLLQDGLDRAREMCRGDAAEIVERMDLWPSPEDCNQVFSSIDSPPDIIYLDLMHHVKKKTEFWKSGFLRLHLPRAVTGSPSEEEVMQTLKRARQVAKERVVEKLPYYAALGEKPSLGPFKTRNWRCNVYLRSDMTKQEE